MSDIMQPYIDLLREVQMWGEPRGDRTGTGTISLFGRSMRFDLSRGKFPLLTQRKIFTKAVSGELIWLIRGERNTKLLHKWGIHIWDEWADSFGELGPVYGKQWRAWSKPDSIPGETVDQLAEVVHKLRHDRFDRRIILSAWNVGELDRMALPPCHMMIQFYVDGAGGLHGQMYQRSADMFIGVPYNIAEYSLLIHLLARITGLRPGSLIHVIGDAHIYSNHVEQVKELLSRPARPAPTVRIEKRLFDIEDLEALTPDDIVFDGYAPHPHISAQIAV